MEERTRPWDSRKWPSAARPGNRCVYLAVPAAVACVEVIVGSFLDRECWRRRRPAAVDRLRRRYLLSLQRHLSEAADANRRAGFCDTASLFREGKSRLRADYCNTSGPEATNVRRVRCGLLRQSLRRSLWTSLWRLSRQRLRSRSHLTRDSRERFARPSAAGRRSRRSG